MSAAAVLAGVLLPAELMQSEWFLALSVFVSINTVLYVTLAIIKTLPKAYLSDWVDRRDRRGEDRSIFPDGVDPCHLPRPGERGPVRDMYVETG